MIKNIMLYQRFVRHLGYIPNFNKPKTFNEKINFRKRNEFNKLFSVCSDKIAVKDWVSNKGYKDTLIENYGVYCEITALDVLSTLEKKGEFLVKANHNSGPVYVINEGIKTSEVEAICSCVNRQLKEDFGLKQGEPWYSEIKPKILFEKKLKPHTNEELRDYKFHVFNNKDTAPKVVVQVDFDRNSNHNRSMFDEDLNWLPFSIEYAMIKTNLEKPENYDYMLSVAKDLAKEFDYARIDLYNVDGNVYFGEVTFAHGSGLEKFSTKAHDKWLGQHWKL